MRRMIFVLMAAVIMAVTVPLMAVPAFANHGESHKAKGGGFDPHAEFQCTKDEESELVAPWDRNTFVQQGYTCSGSPAR